MKESILLRFLYHTVCGRMVLKVLVQPKASRIAGRYLSSGASKWLSSYYIRRFGIDMRGVEIPEGGFSSFNDFFTRKRKTKEHGLSGDCLISPCDGFLTFAKVRKDTVFDLKNTKFSLGDLLKDRKLAAKFQDGAALIFRLTPANYHRYCYAADGRVRHIRKIQGKLHCVRPIALRTVPVYAQNSREYEVIQTAKFGTMVQMEVGALLVGKINNHRQSLESNIVQAGEEKGYFEFGGSTIILLFQKDAIRFNGKLYARKDENGEIPIQMGEFVAVSRTVTGM